MAMSMLRHASNEIYLRSSANQMQSKLHAYSDMIRSTMNISICKCNYRFQSANYDE